MCYTTNIGDGRQGGHLVFLKVFIVVLLSLAAIVGIALVLPLSVRVKYRKGMNIYAGVGFVKIKVYPSKKEKEKKTSSKETKDEQTNTVSKKDAPESKSQTTGQTTAQATSHKSDDDMSVKEVLDFAKDILSRVLELFSKKAKIRIDALKVIVSKPDAADTAIQFGICSGIVSTILAFTSNFGKSVIKDKNVRIEPDFITGKSSVEVDFTLSVKVIHVLSMFLKMLLEDDTTNNKSTKKGNKK